MQGICAPKFTHDCRPNWWGPKRPFLGSIQACPLVGPLPIVVIVALFNSVIKQACVCAEGKFKYELFIKTNQPGPVRSLGSQWPSHQIVSQFLPAMAAHLDQSKILQHSESRFRGPIHRNILAKKHSSLKDDARSMFLKCNQVSYHILCSRSQSSNSFPRQRLRWQHNHHSCFQTWHWPSRTKSKTKASPFCFKLQKSASGAFQRSPGH